MTYLAQHYGDTVQYFGSPAPKAKVMLEKQKFAARWPVRHYAVRTDSMSVSCSSTCTATGIVDWNVSSPQRAERSVGSANFSLELAPGAFVILGENGSVIAAHKEPLGDPSATDVPQPPSATARLDPSAGSVSPGFDDGRQARLDYEQWFTSITDPDYKDGAAFWAAHRSDKTPPSCKAVATDRMWYLGCTGAEAKLSFSDLRRKAEQDFRAGWNSL
jgi:hypothetical protein